MKTRHTPGPWKYHRLDGITGLIAEDGTVLARINTPCNNERTGKANARLIAADPELLDALERIIVDLIGYLPMNLSLKPAPPFRKRGANNDSR